LLLLAFPVFADDGSPAKPPRKIAQAAKGPQKPLTKDAAQEVAEGDVREFVREHHPELADLLDQLKESRPKEYQKALRDLARVRERLQSMKKSDDERYQLELSIWKAETKIQLLAARLQMGDNAELRDQLRQAISEQVDLRLTVMKHERELAKERLSKLDAQIERFDKERSQHIDKQLQSLTRVEKAPEKPVKKPAENSKPAEKPVKKPADGNNKPVEKPVKKPAEK
jgi:hypothetical protein